MKEIRIYTTATGRSPFIEWLENIRDGVTRVRIKRRIDRLRCGNEGDHKSMGKGVFELRLDFAGGIRIYYAKQGEAMVLLLIGGNKRTQSKDIERAQAYWADIKLRGFNDE